VIDLPAHSLHAAGDTAGTVPAELSRLGLLLRSLCCAWGELGEIDAIPDHYEAQHRPIVSPPQSGEISAVLILAVSFDHQLALTAVSNNVITVISTTIVPYISYVHVIDVVYSTYVLKGPAACWQEAHIRRLVL
jgi:hypothetical protein